MSSPTCRRSPPAPKSIRTTRPSSVSITFWALTSRCTSPALWTAASASHSAAPISATLRVGKAPSAVDGLRKRAPAQELHPEADLAVDAGGAVDADDVGMAKAGQQPALIDDFVGVRVGIRRSTQQLECDLAIELGVPRAIHVAERAAGHVFEHVEVPKALRRIGWRRGGRAVRPVHLGDAGDDPQRRHLTAERVGADLLERVPVDGRALADRVDEVLERRDVGAHARRRSIRRTSARSTAIRAAFPVGLPSSCATSS